MDYKEKYNAALEKAREAFYSPETPHVAKAWLLTMFPTIVESEDERIRKEFCKDIRTFIPIEKANKYIAWLEKQRRMLDADKVIEWLRQNNCAACWDNPDEGISQRIEQFKKDCEI